MNNSDVIIANGLSRSFNGNKVVDNISLNIRKGEVYGLLGPNGAGKTTTIRMLTGLLPANSGTVTINGQPLNRATVRHLVGLCPQEIVIWNHLTCMEQLVFIASMYGIAPPAARKRAMELLEALGLSAKRNQLGKNLSGGMMRRMNLLLSLMHSPEIIILDEPEAGLDPQSRVLVRDFILSLARQHTVIFTTHNMDEAERVCDRVSIIDTGRILVTESPHILKEKFGRGDVLEIEISGGTPDIKHFRTLFNEVTFENNALVIRMLGMVHSIPAILEECSSQSLEIKELKFRENSLEDVFIALTEKSSGNNMKIFAVFHKALIMQLRDYWALILTIISAPFFVLVYYVITSGGATTYTLHCSWQETTAVKERSQLAEAYSNIVYSNGKKALNILWNNDSVKAITAIRNRKADVWIVFPDGFSDQLKEGKSPEVRVFGEASNPKYSVGLIFALQGVEQLVQSFGEAQSPYTLKESFLGNSDAKTEFEIYVPGILVFSIIMLILSASLIFIRDIEDRTMIRLKISRMSVMDYLIGNTLVQWIVGIVSFACTLGVAILLGFSSEGSVLLVLLICSLAILSMIAVSLILVAFCRNVGMVLILGNFPLFILMFFSGAMLPMPRNEIFAGFAFPDLLPPTHAVMALNKIFTYGAGMRDLGYEISMMILLTAIYYSLGVVLFRKRHLQTL